MAGVGVMPGVRRGKLGGVFIGLMEDRRRNLHKNASGLCCSRLVTNRVCQSVYGSGKGQGKASAVDGRGL